MKLLLLDAAPVEHPQAAVVRRTISGTAGALGWELKTFFLPDLVITDCAGDFKCWTHTPGICAIDDANRDIARAAAQSDLMVYLSVLSFGGYSSDLKKGVDHLIPNISPMMTTIDGETHHKKRYDHPPRLLGVGLSQDDDAECAQIFRTLVARNSLNLQSDDHDAIVLHPSLAPEQIDAELATILRRLATKPDSPATRDQRAVAQAKGAMSAAEGLSYAADAVPDSTVARPARALILVGSPKARKSSSQSLGGYFLAQLASRGVPASIRYLAADQRRPEMLESLVGEAATADLLVLACPLYVDSLPTMVIRFLERLHQDRAARATAPRAQRLVGIVNCGFPEARHTFTALAILRRFAREAGYVWAGGLPVGGGGMVDGGDLLACGGRARPVVRALDVVAGALAEGRAIPREAVAFLNRPAIPNWLYRFFADFNFNRTAKRHGARNGIAARPHAG